MKLVALALIACFLTACQSKPAAPAAQPQPTASAPSTTTASTPAPAPTPKDASAGEVDVNGDGKKEKIVENYQAPKEETDADGMPNTGTCAIEFSDASIAPLKIGECLDFEYVGSEGDLDGDGAEEISVVIGWPTSAIRDLSAYSYKNGQWKRLVSATINITLLEKDFTEIIRPGKTPKTVETEVYDAAMESGDLWTVKTVKLK